MVDEHLPRARDHRWIVTDRRRKPLQRWPRRQPGTLSLVRFRPSRFSLPLQKSKGLLVVFEANLAAGEALVQDLLRRVSLLHP